MLSPKDANLDGRPEKAFVYLVQSRGPLPDIYADLEHDQADRIVLSWRDPVEGGLFAPGTTWTEGRNRLLSEARARKTRYRYYIFLDDDVAFERGGWREFEQALLTYEPAVATPYFPWYEGMSRTDHRMDAHRTYWFDAMFNAFHSDVVEDGILLPYVARFDEESWWYSQAILIYMTFIIYYNHTLQINGVWVSNDKHEEYPKGTDFKKVIRWVNHDILRAPSTWRGRVTSALRRLRGAGPYPRPRPKRGSYRISPAQKERLLRLDSAFWASRA
ncbi:MAG TPA: hypothetical protein VF594_07525 [Rubricoccaceae bacterium]|jgi:hypothetical protein